LLVLLGTACAPRPAGPSPTSAADPRMIGLPEIQDAIAHNYGNAYQLISSRRSEWLIAKPTGVRGQMLLPTVWMDRMRLGGIETLRTVPLASLIAIQLLTPSEAQSRLGLDNVAGAIVLVTQ
jgi:hypothetical protein